MQMEEFLMYHSANIIILLLANMAVFGQSYIFHNAKPPGASRCITDIDGFVVERTGREFLGTSYIQLHTSTMGFSF